MLRSVLVETLAELASEGTANLEGLHPELAAAVHSRRLAMGGGTVSTDEMVLDVPVAGTLSREFDDYNDEFARTITAPVLRPQPNRMGRPPKYRLTDEYRELLTARYDGRRATYEGLAAATGVPAMKWADWARELQLTNREQPGKRGGTPLSRFTQPQPVATPAIVVAEPETPAVVEVEVPEIVTSEPAEDEIENVEVEDVAPVARPSPIREVETSRPSRYPAGGISWDDTRLLEQLVARLPRRWSERERGRWVKAFAGMLDLVVETAE